MGFNIQLIAVSGKPRRQVQEDYGVEPTGEFEEAPESPVVGTDLPGGAYLLYVNDKVLPRHRTFSRLSRGGSLVALYVYENVGDSYATAWKNGFEEWTVYRNGIEGRLDTSGRLPTDYEEISTRLLAQQKEHERTDFVFDIPVELFVAHGGMRYNKDLPGCTPKQWEILARRRSRVRRFIDSCFDIVRV